MEQVRRIGDEAETTSKFYWTRDWAEMHVSKASGDQQTPLEAVNAFDLKLRKFVSLSRVVRPKRHEIVSLFVVRRADGPPEPRM